MDIDSLPKDPAMLLSYVNMKLRDEYPAGEDGYPGLDEFCAAEGIDRRELEKLLGEAGFEYSAAQNRFW